jgi:hypothetical protein
MQLHLDDDQVEVLRDLLRSSLGDLSMEIADTDNAAFRAGLRRQRELLRLVYERLREPESTPPEASPTGAAQPS